MSTQELKYKAVYNWVLDNINSGALKVGEKLPSENELSERFGLSRQTVRHAVDILDLIIPFLIKISRIPRILKKRHLTAGLHDISHMKLFFGICI